jgi:predicted nuclease of predicted toxin-antitoxin system
VKLLFDENLSPLLATRLEDIFPGSQHVHEVGLGSADDHAIWSYGRGAGFVIATKDRGYLFALRRNAVRLAAFDAGRRSSYIVLDR